MAHIYESGRTNRAEAAVVAALRRCPKAWVGITNLRWISAASGQTLQGETDVLVLAPGRPPLVIEVKGGHHRIDEHGRWWDGRSAVSRAPYQQAQLAAYQLKRYLGSFGISSDPLSCVVFATMTTQAVRGLGLRADQALSADDLADLRSGVERVFGEAESDLELEQVRRLLRPREATLLTLGEHARSAESQIHANTQHFVSLRPAQQHALWQMSGRARVHVGGSAGTGKTVVALARARMLLEGGARILFLIGSGAELGRSVERHLARDSNVEHDRYHVGVGDDAVALAKELGEAVEAVLIDEVQRFSPRQLNAVKRHTAATPMLYTFGDVDQTGRRNFARLRHGWSVAQLTDEQRASRDPLERSIELTTNLRNTIAIAHLAQGFAHWKANSAIASGPVPLLIAADGTERRHQTVAAVLRHLRSEGFAPSEIGVLVTDARHLKALRSALDADDVHWRALRACMDYKDFLGLEVPAVVVVDDGRWVGVGPTSLVTSGRIAVYTALTRGRSFAALVASEATVRWVRKSQRRQGLPVSSVASDWNL